jgi:hypothetical protein
MSDDEKEMAALRLSKRHPAALVKPPVPSFNRN